VISLRKTLFSKCTYTWVAGVSGRVTQHTIFTWRKNLSTDNVSQEAKLTFIKLIVYWTQGEKLSTKMKTTKFTQMCIPSVRQDRRHLAPVPHLYFSAHAYPCGHANITQCLLLGRVFLQSIAKLPWLSPSFQLPIIINFNPSSIHSILGHDDEQPTWNWFHPIEHFTLQLASP
jgi:hypothetical protein